MLTKGCRGGVQHPRIMLPSFVNGPLQAYQNPLMFLKLSESVNAFKIKLALETGSRWVLHTTDRPLFSPQFLPVDASA